ncbi:MAG TPA: hypothetical protein ENL22_04525, partial [candidate division Zixibacteria bacterium]|nr:hypothetical protein [candidate division Zixibacteria bacterium]
MKRISWLIVLCILNWKRSPLSRRNCLRKSRRVPMFRFAGFHITLFEHEIVIPALIVFVLGAAVIALMVYYQLTRKKVRSASIKYSDLKIVKRSARTGRSRFRFILTALRIAAVAMFIVAFARPQA